MKIESLISMWSDTEGEYDIITTNLLINIKTDGTYIEMKHSWCGGIYHIQESRYRSFYLHAFDRNINAYLRIYEHERYTNNNPKYSSRNPLLPSWDWSKDVVI